MVLAVLLLLLAAAPPALGAWYEDTQPIMGTRVHVELWHEDAAVGARLVAEVMAEMRRVEQTYSPYIDDSELSRLNRDAPAGWVKVAPEFVDLLQRSRRVSELTDGAFYITYASVGRYYDYRSGVRPDDLQLARAIEGIDYRYVEVDPAGQRVRFARPEVYVDLGGIAKGYAVDRCVALLRRAGVSEGSVAAGGDSFVMGNRRGKPWMVGVRDPRNEHAMAVVLPLTDTAVSTSGDYERFFEADGVRYHHIIDPTTGDSARRSMSVTILGPDATFTDALSTSVFVLGPKAGLDLINRLDGVDAIIIDATGHLSYSAALEAPPEHFPHATP